AGAAAVAVSVLAAARRALIGALVEGILAGRHRRAGPRCGGEGARPAGPRARGAAAHPLFAETRIALAGCRAGGADPFLAAAAGDAGVGRVAVAVDGAGRAAGAGRSADVRIAGVRRRREAAPGSVARARGRVRDARARLR